MTESCSTCRFWNPIDGNVGECRVDSPYPGDQRTPVMFTGGCRTLTLGFWPATGSGQWCGKYEAKPQPAPPPAAGGSA